MNRIATGIVLLSLVAVPVVAGDENAGAARDRPRSTFRIDYVLSESVAGKRLADRTCTLTVNEGSRGRLDSGVRLPADLDEKGVQYLDLGLRLSARVSERDGDLALETEIERSTIEPRGAGAGPPSVHTTSETLSSRPTLGNREILSTLGDEGGRLQVEVTVTRLR